jgi:integrase
VKEKAKRRVKNGVVFNGTHWAYVLRVPDEVTGRTKPLWVGGFTDEKSAKLARDKARVSLGNRDYVPPTKLTVGEYLTKWISTKKAAPLTLRGYKNIIDNYLIPHLGKIKLQDLRALHIKALYTGMAEGQGVKVKKLSNRTIQHTGAVLRMALKEAVEVDNLIAVNPATRVKLPQVITRTPPPYSREELNRLLTVAKSHRLYFLFRLAAYTGARRSELCALRWTDFDGSAVLISKSRVSDGKNVIEQNRTKGGLNHQRRVTLDTDTVKEFYAHKERQDLEKLYLGADIWQESGYVFVSENGEPIHPDTVTRIYSKLQKKAGLRYNRLNDLRHLHATELLRSGEPLHSVAHRLGHRDAMVTATIYAHIDNEQAVMASETFAERMRGV